MIFTMTPTVSKVYAILVIMAQDATLPYERKEGIYKAVCGLYDNGEVPLKAVHAVYDMCFYSKW